MYIGSVTPIVEHGSGVDDTIRFVVADVDKVGVVRQILAKSLKNGPLRVANHVKSWHRKESKISSLISNSIRISNVSQAPITHG